ncbi:glycerate kinase [Planosporangium thailandense]|uniref:Glycerate kinase n=1 Tax=Planosporangium thailandense TaxID=765197 RepID=A0ABX0Y527_9ACTN|nr:glycerate kinase [Planosporangium thailandense]NJC73438.1 glycerate kinase [Planosporangium thailandense]
MTASVHPSQRGHAAPVVLVAPDKFKGSLTAAQVAAAIADGVTEGWDARVVTRPVADGGDGTLAAALGAGFARHPVVVRGPTGEPVAAAIAVSGPRAVVELASCCGLGLLPAGRPAPLDASTAGLGDAIRAALDAGCRDITVGVGGSASTDAGLGLLSALGARLYDAAGDELNPSGRALEAVRRIDVTHLDVRLREARITVACDVENPLHGPDGAAHVYAPQKGADPTMVELLDRGLRNVGALFDATRPGTSLTPGAGAAGGVTAAALAVLGAQVSSGAQLVLDMLDFDELLDAADVVITGEGSLDQQTLSGKAPAVVAARARSRGLPVIGIAGRATLTPGELADAGFTTVLTLAEIEPRLDVCLADADRLLRVVARSAAGTVRSSLGLRGRQTQQ